MQFITKMYGYNLVDLFQYFDWEGKSRFIINKDDLKKKWAPIVDDSWNEYVVTVLHKRTKIQ